MELAIITGASRGFGRALAVEFSKKGGKNIEFFLLSRNVPQLEETAQLLRDHGAKASAFHLDLSDLSALNQKLDLIFNQIETSNYSRFYLVNNSGSLGTLKFIRDQYPPDLTELQSTVSLNITSTMILTSKFVQFLTTKFPSVKSDTSFPSFIINVTSLLAVKSFKSWAIYAAGKAAREAFHSVLALEEDPNRLKVINYSPGPLNTEMQLIVRETISDQEQKLVYSQMFQEKKLVEAEDSASKLVEILAKNEFQSGSHVDYFDV